MTLVGSLLNGIVVLMRPDLCSDFDRPASEINWICCDAIFFSQGAGTRLSGRSVFERNEASFPYVWLHAFGSPAGSHLNDAEHGGIWFAKRRPTKSTRSY